MGIDSRIILELVPTEWARLPREEQDYFDRWLGDRIRTSDLITLAEEGRAPVEVRIIGARGVDVYSILRFQERRGRRKSSSQTLAAVRELAEPVAMDTLRQRVLELEALVTKLNAENRALLRRHSAER